MAIAQDARVRSTREAMQALGALVTILGALVGGIVWLTGGFRPESQVQIAALSEQIGQLRTAVTDLTRTTSQLPRTSDYLIHDRHLIQLDAQVGAIVDRITHDEIEARGIAQQVQQLTGGTEAKVRNPR